MAQRRALQKEATRDHLFTVAMRLFEERGYPEVSIEEIVRAAGVARGTFYVHFPSKDDVLIELIRRSDERIVERIAAARGKPLPAVLRACTDGFAERWRDRRALLPHAGAVALRRIAGVEEARDRQPLRLELVEPVAAAIAGGELRAGLPAQMLADVFLLEVFAALMGWARTGQPALERVMAGVIDLFLEGATSRGAARAPRRAGTPRRAR
jgi:AcrR family transcriptional regulator